MSIETKHDEHGQLYRWACLVCSKRGIWIRDHGQARKGIWKHRTGRQHLERARQLEEDREERGRAR